MANRHTTDVFIAGGGIIGASIAWRLSQQGLGVTLCDLGALGGEASWAGAGMLVPGSEYNPSGEWLQFALHSLKLYPGFVEELRDASGCPIDFSNCGALELAADDAEWRALQSRARSQLEFEIPSEVVPVNDLRRLIPSIDLSLAGAIFYPNESQVNPRTIMHALRAALTRAGAQIWEGTAIAFIDASGLIQLMNGDIVEAGRIVIAAGAWASLLPLHGVQPIPDSFPVRGHLLGYTLEPGSIPHILRLHHTYIVQRQSGHTIAGTSEEQVGFNRTVDPATVSDIAARAHALCAALPAEPREAWVGFRPGTSHDGPVIGRWLHTNVWLAYGHYRNGILLAPATAERIAREISS